MTRRQHPRSEALTASFVDRLLDAVERTIEARTRVLTAEWLDTALATHRDSEQARRRAALATLEADDPAQPAEATAEGAPAAGPVGMLRGTGRRKRSVKAAPPAPAAPSPEQQRRDAEFARLRALLKPTGQDEAAGAETSSAPAPASGATPPSDPLRLLEDEIRSQAHGLAQLPQTACTARIAAWAGRVRAHEEATGNRVAAQLMLDKLRALARAMDAGRIEALNGAWRTRDWSSYIRANESLAEARPEEAAPSSASLPEPSNDPDYRDVWSQPS